MLGPTWYYRKAEGKRAQPGSAQCAGRSIRIEIPDWDERKGRAFESIGLPEHPKYLPLSLSGRCRKIGVVQYGKEGWVEAAQVRSQDLVLQTSTRRGYGKTSRLAGAVGRKKMSTLNAAPLAWQLVLRQSCWSPACWLGSPVDSAERRGKKG